MYGLLCVQRSVGLQSSFEVDDAVLIGAFDVKAIVRDRRVADLAKLLEHVLVAAVHCEDKMVRLV
jgi:hypothetical protein